MRTGPDRSAPPLTAFGGLADDGAMIEPNNAAGWAFTPSVTMGSRPTFMAILATTFPVASNKHFLAFPQYRDAVAKGPELRFDGSRMARFHVIHVDRDIRTP